MHRRIRDAILSQRATISNAMGDDVTHLRKPTGDWGEAGGVESEAAMEGAQGDLSDVVNTARAVR